MAPYRCNTDEAQYHATAHTLVQLGLIRLNGLGYKYFNLCVPLLPIVLCVAI